CRSTEICGNGVVDFIVGDQCDDDNTRNGDGCAANCRVERLDWAAVTIATPPARFQAGMAYDAARRRVVLFAGGGSSFLADTWEFEGATSTWSKILPATSPPARSFHAMTYDAVRGRVLLFGGIGVAGGAGGTLGDTWEFDGTTWTERTPATSPPLRSDHAL